MGIVIAEVRPLDGTETITHYVIWNNTADKVEEQHPLFEDRKTAELYLRLLNNNPEMQKQLNDTYSTVNKAVLQAWMITKLTEEK